MTEITREETKLKKEQRKFNYNTAMFSWFGLSILLIVGIICISIIDFKDRHSPLQYCIWEIHKHEGYDCEFSYIYDKLQPETEIQKEADKGCYLFAYYITVFTDDRKGEWYCFVEGEKHSMFDGYKPSEIKAIDCDLAFETFYEGEYE